MLLLTLQSQVEWLIYISKNVNNMIVIILVTKSSIRNGINPQHSHNKNLWVKHIDNTAVIVLDVILDEYGLLPYIIPVKIMNLDDNTQLIDLINNSSIGDFISNGYNDFRIDINSLLDISFIIQTLYDALELNLGPNITEILILSGIYITTIETGDNNYCTDGYSNTFNNCNDYCNGVNFGFDIGLTETTVVVIETTQIGFKVSLIDIRNYPFVSGLTTIIVNGFLYCFRIIIKSQNIVDCALFSSNIDVTQEVLRASSTYSFDHNNCVSDYNNENAPAQSITSRLPQHSSANNMDNPINAINNNIYNIVCESYKEQAMNQCTCGDKHDHGDYNNVILVIEAVSLGKISPIFTKYTKPDNDASIHFYNVLSSVSAGELDNEEYPSIFSLTKIIEASNDNKEWNVVNKSNKYGI